MQHTCRSSLALSLAIWSMQLCWFDGGSPRRETPRVIHLEDLRSAYLLREGITEYCGHSADDLSAELRRHFDSVLAILEVNTPRAVEVALDRLEATRDKLWSPAERAQHRAQLLASRQLQLERLRAYRDRGLFPQNEGHADHAVPIFVDNHDTACAVGHLMRLSGWEAEVAEIQATDNLVYVPDAVDSAVAEWVLTAGVTLEEAALIQPAYGWIGPPPIPDDAIDITQTGLSVVFDDLRYSNFRLYTPTTGGESPPVNIPVTHSFCGGIYCSSFENFVPTKPGLRLELVGGPLTNYRVDFVPVASWGSILLPTDPFPAELVVKRAVIQFDVEAVSPLHRIATLPQGSSLGLPMMASRNEIALYATGDMEQFSIRQPATVFQFDPLAIIMEQPEEFLGSPIRPTKHMTIVTEILLRDGQTHHAQLMRFEVVTIPEPATAGLVAVGLVVFLFWGRYRR